MEIRASLIVGKIQRMQSEVRHRPLLSVSVPIRRRQSRRSWHELSSIYIKRQEALQ
jgi:hypothetical protein